MISVIIPIYNTGPSLAKCIDSVLNSTYGDFELILVNDGSTDNSPELCREYCRRDSRVRLIDQENQGASVARNRGLENCRGEWVVFVDSDDSIFPDFLKMIAEEETADLLIFDYTITGQMSAGTAEGVQRISIPLDSAENRADLIERLLRFWQLAEGGHTDLRAPWGKAFRSSVLERYVIRFTPDLRVGEDALFNIEFILTARSCRYIPVPVYWHRIRMGSVSRSYVPDLSESFCLLQRGMHDVLAAHGMFPRLEQAYTANTLENMAFLLIKGIFNPHSKNTARENRELCRRMREDEIYTAALKYNLRTGILPRRILLGFFQMRCYRIVKIICRVCFFLIERADKREEKRGAFDVQRADSSAKENSDKIGILTFHCADNFGAMLQAYGLQKWLSDKGFEAFIINYVPAVLRGREWFFPYRPVKSFGEWVNVSLLTFIRNILTGRAWWVRKKRMDTFRRDYLTKGSKAIHKSKALSQIQADILIVGSDQIWSPDVNFGFQPAYFGAFTNQHIRKVIAYAASVGTDSLPKEAEPEFSQLLDHVDDIYIREKSTAEYIEKRFHRKALHVVDPVFLLDSSQWRMIKDDPEDQDFILYYEAEYSATLREAAYKLAQEKNLKVIELNNCWSRRRWRRWPFEIVYSAGPLQFLGYVDAASYVFTNSFHASAFSILFHKPFHVQNHSIAKARIESLLSSMGLSDYVEKETCRVGIDAQFDWESVETALGILRERSKGLLYDSLTRQTEKN